MDGSYSAVRVTSNPRKAKEGAMTDNQEGRSSSAKRPLTSAEVDEGRLRAAQKTLQEAQAKYREATQRLEAEIHVQATETRRFKSRALNQSTQVDRKLQRACKLARAVAERHDVSDEDVRDGARLDAQHGSFRNEGVKLDVVVNESAAICEMIMNADTDGNEDVISKIDKVLDLLESQQT